MRRKKKRVRIRRNYQIKIINKMINLKLHNFGARFLTERAVRILHRTNPIGMRREISAFLWGLIIFTTFVLVDQYSQSTVNFRTARIQKNEFIKYNQRELPSNDRLPSTRRGLHSIPNNPAGTKGVVLDCTISVVCCINWLHNCLLVGMNSREGMFN